MFFGVSTGLSAAILLAILAILLVHIYIHKTQRRCTVIDWRWQSSVDEEHYVYRYDYIRKYFRYQWIYHQTWVQNGQNRTATVPNPILPEDARLVNQTIRYSIQILDSDGRHLNFNTHDWALWCSFGKGDIVIADIGYFGWVKKLQKL